jgi:uncharacterized protein YsxB (DUF464 family)
MKRILLIASVFLFTNNLFCKSISSEFVIVENGIINIVDAQWELLKSENGINVYVSNYEEADGALKLKIKFENTNSTEINLKCEITAKSLEDFHQEFNIYIKANSSLEFIDATAPISINVGQTEKDFLINFK